VSRVTLQRVFVRGLRLEAAIGVYAHEQGRTQPILIDVELDAALALDGRLASTVNYETVVSAARKIVAEGHHELIETIADGLARACLEDDRVQRVRVTAAKLEAFPEVAGAGFEVVIER
jgi:dihydroneopterin aldolase